MLEYSTNRNHTTYSFVQSNCSGFEIAKCGMDLVRKKMENIQTKLRQILFKNFTLIEFKHSVSTVAHLAIDSHSNRIFHVAYSHQKFLKLVSSFSCTSHTLRFKRMIKKFKHVERSVIKNPGDP